MTQVLARKWRPRNFTELVGQEHVVRALTNALRDQRLHHAYLFTGTRGVGKTTLARIIAKALNCETGVTDAPCGRCSACTEIDSGRFVDLVELDAASNTQVDNMRDLLENAMYAPTAGRYKVYIIDEVHMLSRSAFNAMLKTLEEPPAHVKFILATTDPQRVPVTVLSRCLQFNLKSIPAQQIRERLQHVLDAEQIRHEPGGLALLARAGQGSMRDGLSLLDQAIAHGGGAVTEESTRAMLGAVEHDYLFAILRALAGGDGRALIAEADRMAARSLSFEAALQDLATLVHRLALAQAVPDTVPDDDPDAEPLRELARLVAPDDLQLYYQIAVQGRSDIGLAPDEYAGFTMTLLRMLAFAPATAGGSSRPPAAPEKRTASTPAPASRAAAAPVAAAPVVATTVAAAPAPRSAASLPWPELIERLKLTGMTRMLAQHCELAAQDAGRIELKIAQTHQHLLEKPYQDRLKAALQAHFGNPVRISISLADSVGSSPAAVADREKQQKHAQAVAAIEGDPFVRELVENFDARVIESSIKPVDSEAKREG